MEYPFDIQYFAEVTGVEEPGTEAPEDEAPEGGEEGAGEGETDGEDQGGEGEGESSERFVIGELDLTDMSKEYAEKGALSEANYAELAEHGFSKEIVDAYIAGVKAQRQEDKELADEAKSEVFALVGGEAGYVKLLEWADKTFTEEEKDAYDGIIASGNKHAISMAVLGLKAKYAAKFGSAPKLIKKSGGGVGAVTKVKGFASQSEMIKAMADKKYGRDPDYTRQVDERTAFSEALGYEARK
jgi:hypothetical protein